MKGMKKIIGLILSVCIIISALILFPVNTSRSTANILYGDADNDGDVDEDDIQYMMECVIGDRVPDIYAIEACDFDLDGKIGVEEVLIVSNAVANGISLNSIDIEDMDYEDESYMYDDEEFDEYFNEEPDESFYEDLNEEFDEDYDEVYDEDFDEDVIEDFDAEDEYEDEFDEDFIEDYDESYDITIDEDFEDNTEEEYTSSCEDDVSDYLTVSDWAADEACQALELGLIPDEMFGENLTKTISREKFAALSVTLYEELSGNNAPHMDIADTPFEDCYSRESEYVDYIGSAYSLGLIKGVEDDTFAPDTPINREQLATLLCRVIKKCRIENWSIDNDYDFDISGVDKFADDEYISEYAENSVYFMAKNDIVKGVGNSCFAPRNVTEEQILGNYATATKEQAILMSLRCYNRFCGNS